jgi:hypothetical protein
LEFGNPSEPNRVLGTHAASLFKREGRKKEEEEGRRRGKEEGRGKRGGNRGKRREKGRLKNSVP